MEQGCYTRNQRQRVLWYIEPSVQSIDQVMPETLGGHRGDILVRFP